MPKINEAFLGEQYETLVRSLPEDVMQRICLEFASATPVLLPDLALAVRAGERPYAKSLAHKLKGSAATIGAAGPVLVKVGLAEANFVAAGKCKTGPLVALGR